MNAKIIYGTAWYAQYICPFIPQLNGSQEEGTNYCTSCKRRVGWFQSYRYGLVIVCVPCVIELDMISSLPTQALSVCLSMLIMQGEIIDHDGGRIQ